MRNVKSLFLSDIHLGSHHCQIEKLNNFMDNFHELDNLFLNGDIIDFFKIDRGMKWTDEENKFIRKILKLSNRGTNVVYLIGNHDAKLNFLDRVNFGNVSFEREYVYESSIGSILLLHGDQFDKIIQYSKLISIVGDYGYEFLLRLNRYFPTKKSISSIIKSQVKEAMQYISSYEDACDKYREDSICDYIMTGHIHQPQIKNKYLNTGDWIENCTAIIEQDNCLSLITNEYFVLNELSKIE